MNLKKFKARPRIIARSLALGTDPELFITRNKKVVGSDVVVKNQNDSVIRDGVQVEFNPYPDTCREVLMNRTRRCFEKLNDFMESTGTEMSKSVTLKITQKNFDNLPEESKKFGCSPSFNIYDGHDGPKPDPAEYKYRSAGGHIHLGAYMGTDYGGLYATLRKTRQTVVMLDIILGNTAVMLDRDRGNKERRKYYGHAGEYRLPKHGLEYRTLSNFWLRGTPLFSLVFGLARQAVYMSHDGYLADFLECVDIKDIRDAINNNDLKLAKKNFNKIKHLIVGYAEISRCPISEETLPEFEKMVSIGINNLFPDELKDVWMTNYTGEGIHDYLRSGAASKFIKHG